MKRVLLFIGLPLIVAVVLFVLVLDQGTGSNSLVVNDQSGSTGTAASGAPTIGYLAHPVVPPGTRIATVDRLADGDSFDITWSDTGERDEVRLFGINAPEGDACFGPEARELLRQLTEDVDLLIDLRDRDDFGRALGNVWVDDVLVNLRMVEVGGALVLSDGGTHAGLMEDAVALAQANNAGLWNAAACGATVDANLVIVAIEANAPGQDHLNPNGEWIEIANLGDTSADLTDWSIRDESTRHRYFFPDNFVLAAGDDVRIFSGCGDDDQQSLYWCDGDPVWNNGGDTGFLVDPDGGFADSLSYSG